MLRLAVTVFLILALASCQAGEGEEKGVPVPDEETVNIEDREGCDVKGLVTKDGIVVQGVVVSDGVNVTRTNSEGKYWLPESAGSDFVFISIPSCTEVPCDGWRPGFFRRKSKSGGVDRFDFRLISRDNIQHKMAVITDVHISGRTPALYEGQNIVDSLQFRRYFLPVFKSFAQSQSVPVYALNCGDMMQEIHISKAGLPEYIRTVRDFPVPLFHVIGNHDYEPSLPEIDADDEEALSVKEYYMSHLGPRFYSFNVGKVHYVVLDACRMTGGGSNKYVPHVSKAQMDWLARDLAVADKSYNLVVAMHIAAYRTNTGGPLSVIDNSDDLVALCQGFNHLYFITGDAHISEVIRVDGYITQAVHGALGGSVWWSRTCTDGSQASYTVYDFEGTSLTRTQVPYESSADDQFYLRNRNTYAPDGSKALIINIPAWELTLDGTQSSWSVSVTENGRAASFAPVRYSGKDPYFVALAANYVNPDTANMPRWTNHLFYYIPDNPSALLRVTVTDSRGRQYSKDAILEYDE